MNELSVREKERIRIIKQEIDYAQKGLKDYRLFETYDCLTRGW